MRIVEIREEKDPDLIRGTTCANCIFTKDEPSGKISKEELNKFGGLIPMTDDEHKRAIKADVITMPGKKYPDTKHWCRNEHVHQWVTERMCCNLWSHPGLIKNFDGKEPEL